MNITKAGTRKTFTGRIATSVCAAAVTIGAFALPQKAEAVLNYSYGMPYFTNFDALAPADTTTDDLDQGASTGRNDWFGVNGTGVINTNVEVDDGLKDTNTFYNLGVDTDRAYGFQGNSNYIVFEAQNMTQALDQFTISGSFEAWRRALPADANALLSNFNLQFQVSANQITDFSEAGTWRPITNFTVSTAGNEQPGEFDGQTNPAGPVSSTPFNINISENFVWAPNSYLYIRLANTTDNDSTGALDNLTFTAVPEPSTWIAGGLLLGFAAFTQFRRRKIAADLAA